MAQRVSSVDRRPGISIEVDGVQVSAHEGETLASVLLLSGIDRFHTTRAQRPRAPFCNMGTCFECLVQVDSTGWVRACMTPVRENMRVTTGVCLADRTLTPR